MLWTVTRTHQFENGIITWYINSSADTHVHYLWKWKAPNYIFSRTDTILNACFLNNGSSIWITLQNFPYSLFYSLILSLITKQVPVLSFTISECNNSLILDSTVQSIMQTNVKSQMKEAKRQWVSYQIGKIAGCACASNTGNVFAGSAG